MRAHFSFADADDGTGVAGLERAAKLIAPYMTIITGKVPKSVVTNTGALMVLALIWSSGAANNPK